MTLSHTYDSLHKITLAIPYQLDQSQKYRKMMSRGFLILVIGVIVSFSLAFQPRHILCRISTRLRSEEAGKGFGKKKAIIKEPEQKQPFNSRLNPESSNSPEDAAAMSTTRSEEKNLYVTPRARREAELDEKIARLKEEEDLISSDPSVGAVPELVADRMIGRIVAFFGIPVFGGMLHLNNRPVHLLTNYEKRQSQLFFCQHKAYQMYQMNILARSVYITISEMTSLNESVITFTLPALH
jgi:Photosynthesis affected mutant 68